MHWEYETKVASKHVLRDNEDPLTKGEKTLTQKVQ